MSDKGKVCIIDDDKAVREALRILLFIEGYRTETFESADQFLARQPLPEADVYLLDIRMPGTDGTELHTMLKEKSSSVPVIFITGHGDIPLAVSAMRDGAFDFLTKPFEEGELLEKLTAAVAHYREIRSDQQELRQLEQRVSSLTPRETDVLVHIARGFSNKKVAQELSISPRTVEIHRARVMEKMAADTVASLVRMTTMLNLDLK